MQLDATRSVTRALDAHPLSDKRHTTPRTHLRGREAWREAARELSTHAAGYQPAPSYMMAHLHLRATRTQRQRRRTRTSKRCAGAWRRRSRHRGRGQEAHLELAGEDEERDGNEAGGVLEVQLEAIP